MKIIRRFLAKRQEKKRQQLLALIGRDIEIIARDAYNEGCYVTENRMRAEKLIEFHHLTADNEKLREMMIERAERMLPDLVLIQKEQAK